MLTGYTDVRDTDVNYKQMSQNFLCHLNANSGESVFHTDANWTKQTAEEKKSSDENCLIEIMMSSLNTKNSTLIQNSEIFSSKLFQEMLHDILI
jgi:hypothetical protein